MTDADTSAKLTFQGKSYDLPVIKGSMGPDVVDITNLYSEAKVFTFDPG